MDELPHDLVSTGTAARRLGCARVTIYRWATTGRLRAWRLGGSRLRVSLADVEELLRPVELRTLDVSARRERTRAEEARYRRSTEVLARFGLA